MATTIGWIGTGKMGGPMSRRLIEAGHRVLILEPDAENRALAVKAGAIEVADVAAVAAEASIVFTMIPNDRVLHDLVLAPGGLAEALKPGSTLVEMSTVSPDASKAVAQALLGAGVDYVRAPVSGSTALAQAGTLTVVTSGPKSAVDKVEPLLSVLSAKRYHVGDAEQARYLKLVLNALVGATSSLLAEALAFGRKGDLSIAAMLEVICQSAVASPLIGYKRDMLVNSQYEPAFTVEQMIKDFDLIMQTAGNDHVPMYLSAFVRQQYEGAVAAGNAQRDFFVLCEAATTAA